MMTRVDIRVPALREQYQRIGGGLTPAQVTNIMRAADVGQPALLVDLFNESRQKDGHLQGICFTRDVAVALCNLDFVDAESSKRKDKKALALCRRIRDDFENFSTLVEHLTASYVTGHATAVVEWKKTSDGLLLPYKATRLHAREFIFEQTAGALRYRRYQGDTVGVDLAAENPGRVIQLQRRITGDVQVREGLIRCLVWAAIFRNWSLKDWIALGEIGWKPWRIGSYKKGASQEDIDGLVEALEFLGNTGTAALADTTAVQVEWPKGMAPGTGGSSTHRELLDTMGREMSKAVLGQTTSTEPGPNGDRASTETRDRMRTDICTSEAVMVAAVLRAQMFAQAVAINIGPDVDVPVPWFETGDALDQLQFAHSVQALSGKNGAGVRLPAKWVRGELGAPEPKDGEEVIGVAAEPEPDPSDPQEPTEPLDGDPPPKPAAKPAKKAA